MLRSLAVLGLCAAAALAGPGKKEAERAIADLRAAKDAKSKAAALLEVGKIGQVQKALVASAEDDVVKALEDKEAVVRAAAAETYGMLDPDPKDALPRLRKLLTAEDEDVRVKTGAANGIGTLGPAAKEAVDDLRKVQQEYNKKARELQKPTITPAERMAVRQYQILAQSAANAINRIQPRKR